MSSIYKVDLSQAGELERISKATFYEAFADSNSEADMQQYLSERLSQPVLSKELSNPDSAFYFAEVNGKVSGYLKVNWGAAQTDLRDGRSLEIERIYVLKEFYGAKLGQSLYEKAIEIAKEKELDYIWLGVWEENSRAIRFYEKNGFVAFSTHIFKLGNDEQTDILMRLPLKGR